MELGGIKGSVISLILQFTSSAHHIFNDVGTLAGFRSLQYLKCNTFSGIKFLAWIHSFPIYKFVFFFGYEVKFALSIVSPLLPFFKGHPTIFHNIFLPYMNSNEDKWAIKVSYLPSHTTYHYCHPSASLYMGRLWYQMCSCQRTVEKAFSTMKTKLVQWKNCVAQNWLTTAHMVALPSC